jgi:hypothetical protein
MSLKFIFKILGWVWAGLGIHIFKSGFGLGRFDIYNFKSGLGLGWDYIVILNSGLGMGSEIWVYAGL